MDMRDRQAAASTCAVPKQTHWHWSGNGKSIAGYRAKSRQEIAELMPYIKNLQELTRKRMQYTHSAHRLKILSRSGGWRQLPQDAGKDYCSDGRCSGFLMRHLVVGVWLVYISTWMLDHKQCEHRATPPGACQTCSGDVISDENMNPSSSMHSPS